MISPQDIPGHHLRQEWVRPDVSLWPQHGQRVDYDRLSLGRHIALEVSTVVSGMGQGPAESVESPDDQGIAGAQVREQIGQLGARGGRPADLVDPDP